MTIATIILGIISLILILVAWRRKDESLRVGLASGWKTMKSNAAVLILAFLIVGYINILSPTQLIEDWVGPQSGFRGLVIAEIIGMLLPGGPYVVFPLIAVLYSSGAGIGPAVTIITSWSTQAFLTIGFELPFMGWRFSALRWGLGLFVPLLTGLIAMGFFG